MQSRQVQRDILCPIFEINGFESVTKILELCQHLLGHRKEISKFQMLDTLVLQSDYLQEVSYRVSMVCQIATKGFQGLVH